MEGENNKVGAERWNWYAGPNGDGYELGEVVSFLFWFWTWSFFPDLQAGVGLLTKVVFRL